MNHSFDTTPVPLAQFDPQDTLKFEDVAPLLMRSTSSTTFEKALASNEDWTADKREESTVPTTFDILCGRDKVSYGHVGNRRFRVIVAMNRERYQSCTSRDDKTRITAEIIKSIRECGARFLKLDEDTKSYEEVSDECAHEKVSHALRSAKDPKKKVPRKKRKIARKAPTPQENKAFESLYSVQQQIFNDMLAQQQQGILQHWQHDVSVGI